MLRRFLCVVVSVSFLLSLPGCASTTSSGQQCRRMRGAAAARGVGLAIGAVVALGVVILAVAAAGGGGGGSRAGRNPNFGGSGARRRAEARQQRRAARVAVCHDAHGPDTAAPPSQWPPPPEEIDPEGVMDIPLTPVEGGPPSVEELEKALAPVIDALRACAPAARGTLDLDVRLDGATGRVIGVQLGGPIANQVPTACVAEVTSRIEVHTFTGLVDVRWAVGFPR